MVSYFETEGNNYNYEKGAYNTIDFTWNDKDKFLIIGESKGEFNGFQKNKVFNIKLIEQNQNVVYRQVEYSGKSIKIEIN